MADKQRLKDQLAELLCANGYGGVTAQDIIAVEVEDTKVELAE